MVSTGHQRHLANTHSHVNGRGLRSRGHKTTKTHGESYTMVFLCGLCQPIVYLCGTLELGSYIRAYLLL